MLHLIIFLVLMYLGATLLEKYFKVRHEDVTLMFAGAVLTGAIMNLTSIITLLVSSDFVVGQLLAPGLSLVLNGLFGVYLLKKSKAL